MTTNRGVYIHIPFCKRKCAYCDFYSVSPDTDIILRYIDALCEEIREGGRRYGDVPVDTVYIGGGTPALAGERLLEKIVRALDDAFLLNIEEFTVELNPGDRNPYETLKDLGVNRISIGVQSTSPLYASSGKPANFSITFPRILCWVCLIRQYLRLLKVYLTSFRT